MRVGWGGECGLTSYNETPRAHTHPLSTCTHEHPRNTTWPRLAFMLSQHTISLDDSDWSRRCAPMGAYMHTHTHTHIPACHGSCPGHCSSPATARARGSELRSPPARYRASGRSGLTDFAMHDCLPTPTLLPRVGYTMSWVRGDAVGKGDRRYIIGAERKTRE